MKKSKIDERIDSLFVGFSPEKNAEKVGVTPATSAIKTKPISGFDQIAPHDTRPLPAKRNPASTRQKLFIPLGLTVVCLLTGVFVFARFQTAATAGFQPNLPIPILPEPSATPGAPSNTPNPQDNQDKDTQPPSVPGQLTAMNSNDTTVSLAWEASSDNTGVVGYTIYRNGVSIATTSSSERAFRDIAVMPDTAYAYALDAYDKAGNRSAISAPLQVNTPAQPGNQIFFRPEQDTYVNADNPNTIYGTAGSLRMDSSPDIHAYIRFIVSGLNGRKITQARLMLYTKSGTARGIQVRAVPEGGAWSELGSEYFNAPPLGNVLASSAPTGGATWIALDITPYITGEGSFNFALATDSTTAVSLASRETGAEAPQLILDLQ